VRIFSLGLTKEPLISAVGFVLAGLAGLGVFPFLMWFRKNNTVRWIGILLLLGTAALWGVTFYGSLWGHMASFATWAPATMAPTP
jgi:putative membrane protein